MTIADQIVARLMASPRAGVLIDTRCANEATAVQVARAVYERLVDLRDSGRYPTNIDIVAVAQPTRLLIITVEPGQ